MTRLPILGGELGPPVFIHQFNCDIDCTLTSRRIHLAKEGKDMCCVASRSKHAVFVGFDTIGYKCEGYGGLITLLWPNGWPAPACGTFGKSSDLLPKEEFGGVGGTGPPVKAIPATRPVYAEAPRCLPGNQIPPEKTKF